MQLKFEVLNLETETENPSLIKIYLEFVINSASAPTIDEISLIKDFLASKTETTIFFPTTFNLTYNKNPSRTAIFFRQRNAKMN